MSEEDKVVTMAVMLKKDIEDKLVVNVALTDIFLVLFDDVVVMLLMVKFLWGLKGLVFIDVFKVNVEKFVVDDCFKTLAFVVEDFF